MVAASGVKGGELPSLSASGTCKDWVLTAVTLQNCACDEDFIHSMEPILVIIILYSGTPKYEHFWKVSWLERYPEFRTCCPDFRGSGSKSSIASYKSHLYNVSYTL